MHNNELAQPSFVLLDKHLVIAIAINRDFSLFFIFRRDRFLGFFNHHNQRHFPLNKCSKYCAHIEQRLDDTCAFFRFVLCNQFYDSVFIRQVNELSLVFEQTY